MGSDFSYAMWPCWGLTAGTTWRLKSKYLLPDPLQRKLADVCLRSSVAGWFLCLRQGTATTWPDQDTLHSLCPGIQPACIRLWFSPCHCRYQSFSIICATHELEDAARPVIYWLIRLLREKASGWYFLFSPELYDVCRAFYHHSDDLHCGTGEAPS